MPTKPIEEKINNVKTNLTEHKITTNMGERIGKLVEQYVEAMKKISGYLFEL